MALSVEDRVAVVRQGLEEGLTWSAIGDRLHCSKNAIAGLVRRHIYGKQNGYRNPALAEQPRKEYSRAPKAKPPPRPAPPPIVLPPPPPIVLPVTECQWPLGKRPYRFCAAPAVPHQVYCSKHCRIAYNNWRAAA